MGEFVTRMRDGLRTLAGLDGQAEVGGPAPEHVHKCESGCCPSKPVTTLDKGTGGIVSCLTDPDHPRAARLAAMGILPGTPVRLVQTYPAYVLRVGFSEIALDYDMAHLVRVITGQVQVQAPTG